MGRWCVQFGQRDDSHPGGVEQDGMGLLHTVQNDRQFKTYGWFISVIFHLLFSDHIGL